MVCTPVPVPTRAPGDSIRIDVVWGRKRIAIIEMGGNGLAGKQVILQGGIDKGICRPVGRMVVVGVEKGASLNGRVEERVVILIRSSARAV